MYKANTADWYVAIMLSDRVGFLLRLDSSDNVLVQSILRSSLNFDSRIRVHWMNMLYTTNFVYFSDLG